MHLLIVLLAGALFGGGIAISGMGNPAKVQNFLDLAGQWDPSLAFVMGGGLLITTPGFWLLFKGSKPRFADAFALPTLKEVDGKLLAGAVLFGIGWGVSGLCPAPALVALLTGQAPFFIFAAALVAGMLLHYLTLERRST
ncbi:YeeE/YedE family protein [Spongiibacter taiwanensis]|uniref:DUF6691 family protein n=1 Tax=Spongiibacter taiwanensis TaxID=1748242 RepID=UPI002035DF4B|nr:DUF6691 family protein [Spongiibacter taiwanensis]USA43695.1 YeeE/YedE family protein [Spongiibacter taiwanensis]